jgi:hypothetical protein
MVDNYSDSEYSLHLGFEKFEVQKFQRIVENRLYFNNKELASTNKAKFYDFITEVDRRRSLDFLNTFPEMEDFFEECLQCRTQLEQEIIPIRTVD